MHRMVMQNRGVNTATIFTAVTSAIKHVNTQTEAYVLTIVSRTGSSNVLNSWSSSSLDADRPGTVMSPSNPSDDYTTVTYIIYTTNIVALTPTAITMPPCYITDPLWPAHTGTPTGGHASQSLSPPTSETDLSQEHSFSRRGCGGGRERAACSKQVWNNMHITA